MKRIGPSKEAMVLDNMGSDGLHAAAERVSEAARHVRELATGLLERSEDEDDGGRGAELAADALASVSSSLEAVAESAHASGFALRDRGRDAARALARGERVVREHGIPGAALGTAVLVRRNATRIAVAGAAIVAIVAARRKWRDS